MPINLGLGMNLIMEVDLKKTTIAIAASAFLALIFSSFANAQSYIPQKNSTERRLFLNETRRLVISELGGPIELVVKELKVSGDYAFIRTEPKRPGFGEIDMRKTPRVKRLGIMTLEAFDCCHTEVIFKKQANRWRVIDKSIGATDLWYVSYCGKVPDDLIEDCKYEVKN